MNAMDSPVSTRLSCESQRYMATFLQRSMSQALQASRSSDGRFASQEGQSRVMTGDQCNSVVMVASSRFLISDSS